MENYTESYKGSGLTLILYCSCHDFIKHNLQTYDATNWSLTGKLMNLEYGEVKSRTESAYYTAIATSSLWYPLEISLLSSVSHMCYNYYQP